MGRQEANSLPPTHFTRAKSRQLRPKLEMTWSVFWTDVQINVIRAIGVIPTARVERIGRRALKRRYLIGGLLLLLLLCALISDGVWRRRADNDTEGQTDGHAELNVVARQTDDTPKRAEIRFEPAVVNKTIRRDYDQSATLTLRNNGTQPVEVAAKTEKRFSDLPAEFVGPGSEDEPVQLQPGQTIDLQLAIFAPDATQPVYDIPVIAAGATAIARIRVPQPEFALELRVISEDPHTLAKMVEVINQGASLGDLDIRIAAPHAREVRLDPVARHALLPAGGSLRLSVSPVLYVEFQRVDAKLRCTAAGKHVDFPLSFAKPEGKNLLGVRAGTSETTASSDWYCTNRANICSEIAGAENNGPVFASGGPESPAGGPCSEKCKQEPCNQERLCDKIALAESMKAQANRLIAEFEAKIVELQNAGPADAASTGGAPPPDPWAATAVDGYKYTDSRSNLDIDSVAAGEKEGRPPEGKMWGEVTFAPTEYHPEFGNLPQFVQDAINAHEQHHENSLQDDFTMFRNGEVSRGESANWEQVAAEWKQWEDRAGFEDAERTNRGLIHEYQDEIAAHRVEIAELNAWLAKHEGCKTCCPQGAAAPAANSSNPMQAKWTRGLPPQMIGLSVLPQLGAVSLLQPGTKALPAPERLRPGFLEALGRRASFTRHHRGPFSAPASGADGLANSANNAAGFHAGNRVCFAWHNNNHIMFAVCSNDGQIEADPLTIGTGRWPRLAASEKQTAVLWQHGSRHVIRIHDGHQWQPEIYLSADQATIAFSPDGKLYAAASDGLWILEGNAARQLDQRGFEQPSLAFDSSGTPHVVGVRDGQVYDGKTLVGPGKQPSLAFDGDRKYLAYLKEAKLIVRSQADDGWSEARVIGDNNPSWPTFCQGLDGIRLTYLGSAQRGPEALWLVRLPDPHPLLMPTLAGNVTDVSFLMELALRGPRSGYRPHNAVVTVNDLIVAKFNDTIPEGRYRFRMHPYQVFSSAAGQASNRVTVRTQHMNGGHYVVSSGYKLISRTAWSERFAFADSVEEVLAAHNRNGRLNHDQPDLAVLANNLDLPAEPPRNQPVDFPVTVANLGETASRPATLAMISADERLATVEIPVLGPDDEYVATFRVSGALGEANFQLKQPQSDFDPANDSLKIHLWKRKYSTSTDHLVRVDVVPSRNDVLPYWIAGELPVGARTKGEWEWHLVPQFDSLASHASPQVEGRSIHRFTHANSPLSFDEDDSLVQYVYIDPQAQPSDLVMQMYTGKHIGHWIYWGAFSIDLPGRDRVCVGELPPSGCWVRLRVPVQRFSTKASHISGIRFSNLNGRVYWGPTTISHSRLDQSPEVMVVSEPVPTDN